MSYQYSLTRQPLKYKPYRCLIRTEEMDKTENDLIFIERDKPLSEEEIQEKLDILKDAMATGFDTAVKEALMQVVPTYHTPEEVNGK